MAQLIVSPLVRPSAVAFWQQIAAHIRTAIASGAMPPGHKLPSEPELGVLFGVSRITVRKALAVLVAEAALSRRQGKGTFVAEPVLRHELSGLTGIIAGLQANGVVPGTAILSFGVGPAPPAIESRLGSGAADVLHFRRLYDRGGTPFGLAEIWIPGAAGVARAVVERSPAYAILSDHLGRTAAHADVVIRAERPGRDILGMLGSPRGSTLLHFERTSRAADGTPLEHTSFWVRAESYEFHLRLTGPMPIGAALRSA